MARYQPNKKRRIEENRAEAQRRKSAKLGDGGQENQAGVGANPKFDPFAEDIEGEFNEGDQLDQFQLNSQQGGMVQWTKLVMGTAMGTKTGDQYQSVLFESIP